MKKILLGLLIFFSTNLKSQDFKENFSVRTFIEFHNNDSVKFYFNSMGNIDKKSRADFYRIGKIDSTYINVTGKFRDYYINGNIALEATIKENCFEGKASYYHKNGEIKSIGNYKKDSKNGIWKYFYKDGQLEKVVNFVDGVALVVAHYNKKGEQVVINGNGNYKGYFYNYKSAKRFKIEGVLKNGLMDGKWSIYTSSKIGNEYFEDGIFIKGESRAYNYSDRKTIDIIGHNPHEDLNLYDNYGGLGKNIIQLYSQGLNLDFPQKYLNILSDSLNNSIKDTIQNQWVFVNIKLKKINRREDITIKSSINDKQTEEKIFNTLKSVERHYDIINKLGMDIKLDYFFTILIKDNIIVIPTDYIHNNKINTQNN